MRGWIRLVALPLLVAIGCAGDDAREPTTTFVASATAGDDGLDDGLDDGDDLGSTDSGTTSHDGSATDGSDGTDTGPDDGSGDTGVCPDPIPDAAWIETYQTDLVARLTGAAEVSPGVMLPDRATPSRRTIVRDLLQAELSGLGLSPQLHGYDDGEGANVWVGIEATAASDETIVFGAHFDSVPGSPGANDNATGVAAAMSLARWLAEQPCRDRNVIVVFLDQEEIGLVGAYAFASFLVTQALDVVAVHTIDQMGWDADGDRTIELERADTGLVEHYETAAASYGLSVAITPTQTGATDHVAFRELGFSAVGITEEYASGDTTPHYHAPTDTFETVDFDYLRSTTVLVHAAFAEYVAP
jgi:hypothetical protein